MNAFNQQTIAKLEELRRGYEALSPEEKDHWKEEERKCLESPLYFYNNYLRKEGNPKLTQEEFDRRVSMVELERTKIRNRERFGFTPDLIDFNITIKK